MIKRRGVAFRVGVAVALLQFCGFSATNQVVVPAGLENAEGSTRDSVLKGGPAERNVVISSATLPPSWNTPVIITALAFRLEGQSTFSFNAVVPRLEIRLSTTTRTPATMGNLYSDNAGPDSIVAFAHDDVHLTSENGPGPTPFGLFLPLDRPFLYNANSGNLLYNLKISGGSFAGSGDIDAQGLGGGAFATTVPGITTVPLFVMPVTEFSWIAIPEPKVSVLLFLGVPAVIMIRKRGSSLFGVR
jgi:hypothetical protein